MTIRDLKEQIQILAEEDPSILDAEIRLPVESKSDRTSTTGSVGKVEWNQEKGRIIFYRCGLWGKIDPIPTFCIETGEED